MQKHMSRVTGHEPTGGDWRVLQNIQPVKVYMYIYAYDMMCVCVSVCDHHISDEFEGQVIVTSFSCQKWAYLWTQWSDFDKINGYTHYFGHGTSNGTLVFELAYLSSICNGEGGITVKILGKSQLLLFKISTPLPCSLTPKECPCQISLGSVEKRRSS